MAGAFNGITHRCPLLPIVGQAILRYIVETDYAVATDRSFWPSMLPSTPGQRLGNGQNALPLHPTSGFTFKRANLNERH
jgi:hypothetical protein